VFGWGWPTDLRTGVLVDPAWLSIAPRPDWQYMILSRERSGRGNPSHANLDGTPGIDYYVSRRLAGNRVSGYVVTIRRSLAMKTRVVRIGNSRGIRIPKVLLEQTGLPVEVEISAEGDSLVIRPANRPRTGWAAAFQEMALRGDDCLLDEVGPSSSNWDRTEWEW
jgi:antitoxin MazE